MTINANGEYMFLRDNDIAVYKGVPPLPAIGIRITLKNDYSTGLLADPPVTLAAAKEHLRIDTNDEDALIQSLVDAATAYAQDVTNTIIAESNVTVHWSDFPQSGVHALGVPFGSAVLPSGGAGQITYPKTDGTTGTLDSASGLSLRSHGDTYALILAPPATEWPTDYDRTSPSSIEYFATFLPITSQLGQTSQVAAAIKMLVGNWYANREGLACGVVSEVPYGVKALLQNNTFHGGFN